MKKLTFFSKLRRSRTKRIISAFLVINLIAEIISPSLAMALTSGPSSPEFSSFEPVATTDMVNDFTGDFTYNIPVLNVPGPDGAGYAMSLAYHSGSSSEEEASWVGFGWTLNPGAINRNKRGFPDEYNGESVMQYNKQKPNWTQSAKFDMNIEYNSSDDKPKTKPTAAKTMSKILKKLGLSKIAGNNDGGDPAEVSVSVSHTIRYNNYSGFSIANGFGVTAMGLATVSMNRSGGQNTFGFSVNPMAIMKKIAKTHRENVKKRADASKTSTEKKPEAKTLNAPVANQETKSKHHLNNNLLSHYAIHSNDAPALSFSVGKNAGASWNFSTSIQLNPSIPVGFQIGIAGNFNIQAQEAAEEKKVYGYMYSSIYNLGNSTDGENVLHDFQMEKETTFNKHDKNLGIPFNNADNFTATGNNVIGGFRLNHDKIGSFYPENSESVTRIRQTGVELGIGLTFQIGFDIGVGKHKTQVSGQWPKMPALWPAFSNTSPMMRFTGDLGGEMKYDDFYDSLYFAKINQNKALDLGTNTLDLDNGKSNSSASIKYIQNTSNPKNEKITGMQITNKDGGRSDYMLPVYTKDENELTIGLEDNEDGKYLVTHTLDVTNPLLNKTVVGQKSESAYPATYLLTQNTTFNYVDVNGDGKASEEDFGGWTAFDYRQAYGGSAWYRFRSPYAGLNYNDGRMVDREDQTGAMSCGNKEVYYLKCIETKTHLAFFITNKTNPLVDFPSTDARYALLYRNNALIPGLELSGSTNTRYDGVDAAIINANGRDLAAESLTAKGTNTLEKLERIVLFAKADLSKPLTTTFFEYDYSLCQGIPNSVVPANAPSKDKGKLTLKRVWTESGGVNNSRMSPYQFHYEYFHQYPSNITSEYLWAASTNTAYTTNDANQNPFYKPEQLDMWGNYQEKGAERYAAMQPWLSQKPSSAGYDPAAWQLKRIQLPSGGEIHVQYEQKDYLKVQDQTPMAMVSLLPDADNLDDYTSDKSMFCINMADLDVTAADIGAYKDELERHFITGNRKLYFKMLYTLSQDDEPALNTGTGKYEYMTGYAEVHKVTINGTKIFVHLGDIRDKHGNGKKDKTIPRWVCYQELLTNGAKNLGPNAGSYLNNDAQFTSRVYGTTAGGLDPLEFDKIAIEKVFLNTVSMFKDWVSTEVKNVKKADACKHINFPLSYFKLPVYHPKKGGGIRVKRLVTYDEGISGEINGDASVFGTEYNYITEEGGSSGVATNEPQQGREENALVGYIERKPQKHFSKILNGRDTKQFEGPLGESILPAASIAHSRVIIKNIHSGNTTTGFVVNTYFTVNNFPFKAENSTLGKENDTYKKFNLSLPLGLFNLDIHRAWVTQGYLFKENDMNGKMKSKATYSGNYDAAVFKESRPTSITTYNYSTPGTSVPALVFDKVTDTFKKEMLNPGAEEDFTMFSSNVHENSNDFSVELDINVSIVPPDPIPVFSFGWGISYSYSDQLLCQQVTSKVVSQKSYLLSTTNITDGVTQTTENLAFDKYTGDPVLTRTFDGFMAPNEGIYTQLDPASKHNGYYYSLNIPASWMYPDMGPRSLAASNTNQLSAMVGNVVTYGSNALYDYMIFPGAPPLNTAWNPINNPLTNVVSASATTYTNNWFKGADVLAEYPSITATPTVGIALNKFYYPLRTFSYKESVTNANSATAKIYNGGITNVNFKFFDWNAPLTAPAEWYSDGYITRYSPFGYPVEEKDVLGIKSSAKFGYNNTLPVSVVQNAGYDETKFIDFEYGFIGSNNLSTDYAHSGRASFDLFSNKTYNFVTAYPLSTQIMSKGLGVKLWLRSSLSDNPSDLNYRIKNANPQLKVAIGAESFTCNKIAETGEWALYSAEIKNFNSLVSNTYAVKLSYNFLLNESVFIDDFRIQPLDASMNCSVYTADNKVSAQFDDQHFGVYYEYNTKGQLVRKSIETERGKKTLQEQQYNTPLINKN